MSGPPCAITNADPSALTVPIATTTTIRRMPRNRVYLLRSPAPRGRRGEEAMTASSTSNASTSSTMTRREFGELVAGTLVAAAAQAADAQSRATSATTQSSGAILDVADWSYYWYGVEYATLA